MTNCEYKNADGVEFRQQYSLQSEFSSDVIIARVDWEMLHDDDKVSACN